MTQQETMDNVDYANRDLPLKYVTSADGTTIAYEQTGSGPPVIIVGGGLNEKAMHAELAEELSHHFTVFNYDRRARGDSDDKLVGEYTVQCEIEDLHAVMEAAGEPCAVFANCSGAMVAFPAAASGVPMTHLAVYEPPYGGPRIPGILEQVQDLVRQGKRTDAVARFLQQATFEDQEIEFLKTHPIWPAFEAMTDSLPYDTALVYRATEPPADQLSKVTVPTLVLGGEESAPWMQNVCAQVAQLLPQGRYVRMQTAGHLMDEKVGAALLSAFFTEDSP